MCIGLSYERLLTGSDNSGICFYYTFPTILILEELVCQYVNVCKQENEMFCLVTKAFN